MKLYRTLLIAISTVVFMFAPNSSAEAVVKTEHQAVIDTAFQYFKGVANGDQTLLNQAFDMEYGHIKMINVDQQTQKETIRSLTLKEFAAYFKQATKETWTANVLSVDLVDNKMAMVKLDFDTPKSHYIDYLVMYKRNGNWKIINKTFTEKSKQ